MTTSRDRTRSAAALFAGVAVSAMGYTIMVAVLPLAAEDLLGSARWSGVPGSLGTLGVAVGAGWLASLMSRRGRRSPLALGYCASAVAATVAAVGAAFDIFPVMAGAMFVVGVGYAASRLSRYAAADLYEPAHRSAAIGWNVWAATIGAVSGPMLLSAAQRGGASFGWPLSVGPFALAAIAFAVAATALRLVYVADGPPAPTPSGPALGSDGESPKGLRLAVVSLVSSQVVMILIMTMTPVYMRQGGEGLDAVGVVFAAHTFGMFAMSPVAGLLSDRFGRVPVIVAACLILVAGGLVAASAGPSSPWLAVALFLLGLGWCFSLVSASALVTESVNARRRVRVQGVADSLVWGSAAVAGLASGLLLFAVGYQTLSAVAAGLALLPLLFVRRV